MQKGQKDVAGAHHSREQARAAYETRGQDQASLRSLLHTTLNKLREERHALSQSKGSDFQKWEYLLTPAMCNVTMRGVCGRSVCHVICWPSGLLKCHLNVINDQHQI